MKVFKIIEVENKSIIFKNKADMEEFYNAILKDEDVIIESQSPSTHKKDSTIVIATAIAAKIKNGEVMLSTQEEN